MKFATLAMLMTPFASVAHKSKSVTAAQRRVLFHLQSAQPPAGMARSANLTKFATLAMLMTPFASVAHKSKSVTTAPN